MVALTAEIRSINRKSRKDAERETSEQEWRDWIDATVTDPVKDDTEVARDSVFRRFSRAQ